MLLSLIAASLGFLIVLSGVAIILTLNTSLGSVIAVSSIIPEVIAALFFLQLRDANKRESNFRKRLLEVEGIHRAMELVPALTDDTEIQKHLKETIILRILDLPAKVEEIPASFSIKQSNQNHKTPSSDAANETRKQLGQIYEQEDKQAEQWFRISLGAAVTGFLPLIVGITAIFLGYTTVGILISIATIIPEITSALFFLQSRETNKRVDNYSHKLFEIDAIYRATDLVSTLPIDDQKDLKKTIILRILDLSANIQKEQVPVSVRHSRRGHESTSSD